MLGNFTVEGNQLSAKGTTNLAIVNGIAEADVIVQGTWP